MISKPTVPRTAERGRYHCTVCGAALDHLRGGQSVRDARASLRNALERFAIRADRAGGAAVCNRHTDDEIIASGVLAGILVDR